ncbi:protein kinase family protein [Spirillospora albida]|uniref:protein kinase family protein n=1 Tax=Spirillospora albida TaxID=58123 RepID=UPI0004C13597|nr:protein kinase family protein [Spirillospora albida]
MSTSVIEPGTRLAGRYRLEERISDIGGSSLWRAIDEILARAVAVRTFAPEFPRIGEAVTSARAASRLTDPRLTQVFDADDTGESAYIVSEWVAGETLEHMLAKAPLEPGRATTLLCEASEAIAAAHAAGLAHLCLTPRDLVWTTGGTVKILGVAIEAVLCDRESDDPAGDDVAGLGALLYAALTAHWPGPQEGSGLPPAPESDGVPQAPRQVQAGISQSVDAIVCRSLGITGRPSGPDSTVADPIATPADLAKALRGVPRTPLPLFAGLGTPPPPPPPPSRTAPDPAPAASTARTHQPPPSHVPPPRTQPRGMHAAPSHPGRPRGPVNRALLGVAAAAATVVIGLGAWALTDGSAKNGGDDGRADPGRSSAAPQKTATKLAARKATAVEQRWMGGSDTSIGDNVGAVIDGSPKAVWHSQSYSDRKFGNFLRGLGVLIDMGRPVTVSKVQVAMPDSGATIELRVGGKATHDLPQVAQATSEAGEFTLKPASTAKGRYVVVWFTELPSSPRAQLGEVTVYGTAG